LHSAVKLESDYNVSNTQEFTGALYTGEIDDMTIHSHRYDIHYSSVEMIADLTVMLSNYTSQCVRD